MHTYFFIHRLMISHSFLSSLTAYFHTADPETLTDRALFETAQRIGGVAVKARRAFIGLLPLIERRRAYEGRSFYSIYDFAAKVGGVSRGVVDEVMRVDRYLVDTPKLRKKLYRGEIGWTKIRTIVHMLTKENEDEWIVKLESLSRVALEAYVRDYRMQIREENVPTLPGSEVQMGMSENVFQNNANVEEGGEIEAVFLPGKELLKENENQVYQDIRAQSRLSDLSQYRETFTFSMKSDIAARLRLFRQRLEKDRRELVTWEEVMVEFLKMIEGEARYEAQKKSEKGTRIADVQKITDVQKPVTRYIPAYIRHQLDAQYEGLCAFKECKLPATIYHHTRRFSLVPDHNPCYIKPLCTAHERIVHATLIENEDIDPSSWKLLATPDAASPRAVIDQKVQQYRKPTER